MPMLTDINIKHNFMYLLSKQLSAKIARTDNIAIRLQKLDLPKLFNIKKKKHIIENISKTSNVYFDLDY